MPTPEHHSVVSLNTCGFTLSLTSGIMKKISRDTPSAANVQKTKNAENFIAVKRQR